MYSSVVQEGAGGRCWIAHFMLKLSPFLFATHWFVFHLQLFFPFFLMKSNASLSRHPIGGE